jgi:hypothetical protein
MTPQELIEMTNTPEKCEQLLIQAVRMLSSARAEIDCQWEDVNDCMNDGDILEYLSDAQMNLPKAMQAIQDWLNEPVEGYAHQREYNPDNYRGI